METNRLMLSSISPHLSVDHACIDDNYKEKLFLYIFISDRTYSRRCNGFGVYNYEAQNCA